MKDTELDDYSRSDYLRDGHPEVLDKVRPAFHRLIGQLRLLSDENAEAQRLTPFAEALGVINEIGGEIETEERETILGAIYDIGRIVGLDVDSEFAETWRGDW